MYASEATRREVVEKKVKTLRDLDIFQMTWRCLDRRMCNQTTFPNLFRTLLTSISTSLISFVVHANAGI